MEDIIELVMAVEEAFDLEIPNDEAEKLMTAGDLHAFINRIYTAKFGPPQAAETAKICLSSAAFYRVRRALMDFGAARANVTPAARLEELLPAHNRPELWRRFSGSLGVALPGLQRSPSLAEAIHLFVLVLICSSPIWGLMVSNFFPAAQLFNIWLGCLAYSFFCWAMLWQITKLFAVHPPRELATVGDLTRHLAPRSFGYRAQKCGAWNEHELWQALRNLIAEEAGVPREQIKKHSRFDDLMIWD